MIERNQQVADEIKAMIDLLTPPGVWIQHVLARDKDGNAVFYEDPNAVCFCLVGALSRVTFKKPSGDMLARTAIRAHIDDPWLSQWNDRYHRTQEQVLSMLKEVYIDVLPTVPTTTTVVADDAHP